MSPPAGDALARARAILAEESLWGFLGRTVAGRRWVLLERDLGEPVPSASAAVRSRSVSARSTRTPILALRAEADLESIRLALDAVQWGFGAWLDGRVVH